MNAEVAAFIVQTGQFLSLVPRITTLRHFGYCSCCLRTERVYLCRKCLIAGKFHYTDKDFTQYAEVIESSSFAGVSRQLLGSVQDQEPLRMPPLRYTAYQD